ncbi:hypothetical protein D3C87_1572320 [compost metagenome]
MGCLQVQTELLNLHLLHQRSRESIADLQVFRAQVGAIFDKIGIGDIDRTERAAVFLDRRFCIVVVGCPRIVQCGFAFGTGARRVEVAPPQGLVPELVTLNAVEEQAEIKAFVIQSQIQTVAEIRVRVAEHLAVGGRDLAVAVDVLIAETSYRSAVLEYRIGITG